MLRLRWSWLSAFFLSLSLNLSLYVILKRNHKPTYELTFNVLFLIVVDFWESS